jgi:L-aminopeptidase/D-esterase-like protein
MLRPGPLNRITDVPGVTVGHATDLAEGTGVTTLLLSTAWPTAVDVRGGGPGVRETETLAPENLVGRAHAIVLSGGSVFGLAAADGVAMALSDSGTGLQLRPGSIAIPIVPAAVLFDLGVRARRSADYRELGERSVQAAVLEHALGSVGAGTGARAGLVKGGIGSASIDLGDGIVVGALVAVNSVGSALMPDGTSFWAWPFEIDGEFGGRVPHGPGAAIDPMPDLSRLNSLGRLTPGAATTLGIGAASAELTTAECKRVAIMAQDGIARAIRPVHTPFDGDVVFATAAGVALPSGGTDRAVAVARIGSAAADCLARAIARGVYLAAAAV